MGPVSWKCSEFQWFRLPCRTPIQASVLGLDIELEMIPTRLRCPPEHARTIACLASLDSAEFLLSIGGEGGGVGQEDYALPNIEDY